MLFETKDWRDPRIHSFGNQGVWGGLHAGIAPFFTWMLDKSAYGGVNVREATAFQLAFQHRHQGLPTRKILDLGCGTGPMTRAMALAFENDGAEVLGVDTSKEMLAMAELATTLSNLKRKYSMLIGRRRELLSINNADNYWTGADESDNCNGPVKASFFVANAEDTGLDANSFDIVCATFFLHEAPSVGRNAIMSEARRCLKPGGTFLVLDIAREYQPSPVMKSGEPYIEGYLKNIESEISTAGFEEIKCYQPIKGRAEVWVATEPICKKIRLKDMKRSEKSSRM